MCRFLLIFCNHSLQMWHHLSRAQDLSICTHYWDCSIVSPSTAARGLESVFLLQSVPRRSDGRPRHGCRTPGKCIFIVITLPSRGIWWKWRSEEPAEVRTGTGSIITCSLILCVALSNSVNARIVDTFSSQFLLLSSRIAINDWNG